MFEEADRDSDGLINTNEFYRVMRKREDPLDDWSSDEDEWLIIWIFLELYLIIKIFLEFIKNYKLFYGLLII